MMLGAVKAGMAAEHSTCLRWRDGGRAESITASGTRLCSEHMLLGNFYIKRHSSLNPGNIVIASPLCWGSSFNVSPDVTETSNV